jgi:hypothetical protein
MLSTSRIISRTLAGQWFLASRLVSVRQRAVAYSNAKISTPAIRTRPHWRRALFRLNGDTGLLHRIARRMWAPRRDRA